MKPPLISAVIFDFNGTLFFDTEFHNQAWKSFSGKYAKTLGIRELEYHVHGCTNKEILEYIFKRDLSSEEIISYSLEKEAQYREICTQNPDKCVLTPGAEYFLDRLTNLGIPRIIATASNAENVAFFIRMFDLGRWFDTGQIVYDTGEFRGKPFPDMFLAAANRLGLPMSECLVVEDSIGGVHAAKNAGAARIVAVSNDDKPGKFSQLSFIDQIITDFRQLEL
ncbi:MAG: HAD family phosphatase [Bacteroidales bacterium]|nr:HAD family phosphatase [Bacteroidales bacterium]